MKSKKIVSALVICQLLVSGFSTIAFAGSHHGHGGVRTTKISYSACTVDSCNLNYNHTHNGKYYYAHSLDDGHDYHKLCTISDCTETITHIHDEVSYFGHHIDDGHNYHNTGQHH